MYTESEQCAYREILLMYYSMDMEGEEDPWNIDFGIDEPLAFVSSVSADAREGMANPLLLETSSMNNYKRPKLIDNFIRLGGYLMSSYNTISDTQPYCKHSQFTTQ